MLAQPPEIRLRRREPRPNERATRERLIDRLKQAFILAHCSLGSVSAVRSGG
jgi:hypothetical protein